MSDVDERMLVGDLRVQGVHLCQSSLHEVDHGQRVRRRELAVLHIGNVHLLQREKSTMTVRHHNAVVNNSLHWSCRLDMV